MIKGILQELLALEWSLAKHMSHRGSCWLFKLEVQNVDEFMKQPVSSTQVMLGVDRLDMIKGIPQKLLAFEKFLEENPEWRDRVLLVQIAVPSRTDVPEYQVSGQNRNIRIE